MNLQDVLLWKGFKIAHVNCRSILNKVDEIAFTFQGIDILACSETWLCDAIPNNLVEIPNMDLFRFDRDKGRNNGTVKLRGGGVSCYIRRELSLSITLCPGYSTANRDIEIMTLKCRHVYGKLLHIIVVYRPPYGSHEEFFNILSNFIDSGNLAESELYICGDFNINFLHRNDIKSKSLIYFLRTHGLIQHINSATRISGFSKSCIDFIISNIPSDRVISAGVLDDVISDHYPVFLCVKKQRNTVKFCKIKGRTYRKYDKEVLQTLIERENWDIFYNTVDPSELWDIILNTITMHLDVMCPMKFIRIRENSPPWISQDIVEAINDRNSLYKTARMNNSELNIRNARSQRNRVNKLINNAKSAYIKTTLENNRDDPKKFWRILNNTLLKGDHTASDTVFDMGNEHFTQITDSCEFMNDYIADIGVKLHDQFRNTSSGHVFQNMYNLEGSDEDIVFNRDDILHVVNSIDIHKSSGIDYIPSFILKDCFLVLLDQLMYLFNQSIALCTFPDCWKVATITPIPKAGDQSLANNWRPISIIPLIGKMMESLCNSILNNYLDTNDILVDEQYGFRKSRSTGLSIFNYVKFITENMNVNRLVGSIYVDFARAFDSINHVRLIEKLTDMGIPLKLLFWIEDYLSNSYIRTKLNNCVSSPRVLLCGVPQGSILGPTLFNCYINDLVLSMRESETNISLYADDAVLFCSDCCSVRLKSRLETLLSKIIKWSENNYINLNVQKTKFCIYGSRSHVSKFRDSSIFAKDESISRCLQYNYLGVDLDECMTLTANFNKIFKKYSYKIYQFGKIRRYLDTYTRILVYKQTILPLVEYVSFMLCLNKVRDVDKLQKLQNRCLRSCFNIYNPRDMSVDLLHHRARVNKLDLRRDVQLFNIMFSLKLNNKYKKISARVTRNVDRYVFKRDIVHKDVYGKSPYLCGVSLWNTLSVECQNITDKRVFKNKIKKHLDTY